MPRRELLTEPPRLAFSERATDERERVAAAVGIGFVPLTEALDRPTPGGRVLAGMLAVFAEFERDILRDCVKAGIAQARKEGRPHGRPATVVRHTAEIQSLFKSGVSKRQITARLDISRPIPELVFSAIDSSISGPKWECSKAKVRPAHLILHYQSDGTPFTPASR